MKHLGCWLIGGVVGIGVAAGPQPARAQWGRVPQPARGSGMGLNPYTNPYMNPYANPYLYAYPSGGLGAAMVFMTAERAQAEAAQARAETTRARDGGGGAAPGGRAYRRGSMAVPGGGAAGYFGGGVDAVDESGASRLPRGGYFQQHDRYFHPNGY